MARHTKVVTIEASGRDKGKRFFLTEMSAAAFAEWVMKATFAISKNGGQVSPDFIKDGIPGLLMFGLTAITTCSFEAARPLVDEIMACVQTMPGLLTDSHDRRNMIRPTMPEDFEEYTTVLQLQKEALELHLGFSIADKWLEYQLSLVSAEALSSSNMGTSLLQ
jgi:hypothetical protein